MKTKSAKAASSDPDVRRELRALRQAARSARRLSQITGTPFIVVKNGRIVDLNKGRKQSAKQKELVKLLRPFGA
ncbi:MAG: hypothetical protein ABSB74_08355 [Tepidisphaeraceae bacterium]